MPRFVSDKYRSDNAHRKCGRCFSCKKKGFLMKFEWDEEKDAVRLISARFATKAERRIYDAQDIYY